jgi:hypothetical protein
MSEQPNNTDPPKGNKGAFKKGDKRINRKGRPKSFDALRQEAQKIAGEILASDSGNAISRINLILLDWATSKDPRKQQLFMEYAYGKVPQKEEITGADGGAQKMIIEVVRRGSDDSPTGVAEPSPETTTDQSPSNEV